MRLLEILIGLGITVGCGFAVMDIPWSIESTCRPVDEGVRCEVTTEYLLAAASTTVLGPGPQVEARAMPTGAQDKAFRPRLAVGSDTYDLPLLVDTHKQALGVALKHAVLEAPVRMHTSHGRHALVIGFGALGLLLALNALRKMIKK